MSETGTKALGSGGRPGPSEATTGANIQSKDAASAKSSIKKRDNHQLSGCWTIRSRLTVRGFKDNQKGEIARYAGTSTRGGQKTLVSEAVRNRWPICTLDISVAFLKGVTYEELAALTGEPMREVNFYLPAACIPLLRQVPGSEDFDPRTEVLHCDKPGTGLTNAPRAFSLKLKTVTEQKCRMKSSLIDAELCIKH